MSVQMAPPTAAAAVVQTQTTTTPPAAATHPYKPVPAAKTKTDQPPTEMTAARTAYSNTYDNHDGSFTASVSADPINYKPSGSTTYQPIDLTLTAISGGKGRVRAGKTPVPVEVGAPDDAAGFVSADTGKGKISLSLAPGAKPGRAGSKPVTSSGRATVVGLLSGVDLEVSPSADGFTLFLTLASRPTTSSFTFTLDSGGLTPALQSDGSISFTDKSKNLVATMPHPYATDSSVDDRRGGGQFTDKVKYALSKSAGKDLLTVTVDSAWLASAVYPVYVDPSVSTGVGGDTFVSKAYPSENFNGYQRTDSPYYKEMWLGTDPTNSTNVNYDLIKFTLPAGVAGSTVNSATLSVFPYWQYEHYAAVSTSVDIVNATWNTGAVTWNSKPTSTNITSASTYQGYTGTFNVISAVTSWAAGAGNYGFLLHDASSGTAWKRLIASEQGGSNVPTLSITYNLPAATPTSPISANWTSSRTLSWSYYDQSAIGETSYAVTVATDSSFTSPIVSTGWVASAATSYSIPASTTLTDGTTYWWKVQVKAGTDVSAESSASFKWDSVAPVWGGFTAPTAAVDQAGSSFTFAWNAATDANSGVAGYSVLLESAQIGSLNTCSTNWDESGTPTTVTGLSYVASNLAASTCYRLRVLAKDAAGNPVSSPTYSYSATILRDATPPDAPTVDDNCASIKTCYRVGDTIYYLPSASATVHLTSTGADPESGIVSSSFGAISPSTGWTYTSGTVSGNPASKDVEWSTSAGGVTLAVTTTNGAGVPSAARTITFVPDSAVPVANFSAPAEGSLETKTATSYSVDWTEADGGSGIASSTVQRQRGSVVSGHEGTCTGVDWSNDGDLATATAHVSVDGLESGDCYRWVLTLTDNLGNSATHTSGSLLVDSANPDLPNVAASGTGIYQGGPNGAVYFLPALGGSVTLTTTVDPTPPSGLNGITYNNLTSTDGYTANPPLPITQTTSPYSETLAIGANSGATSIDIAAVNGLGVSSPARTLGVIPDNVAPVADFSNGSPATGATLLQTSTTFTVAWSEADAAVAGLAGSGVASRTVQRQRGHIVSGGNCDGVNWANDGASSADASPRVVSDLVDGYCYRWLLILTDHLGNTSGTFTSGSVLVDSTAPSAAIAYPESGRPVFGTVDVTGSVADADLTDCILEVGSGVAPTAWTTINSSCSPSSTTSALGTWATANNTGTYTLRLTVTDGLGHVATVTNPVYVDNTDRGSESYNTSVPFGLGGGWNLGVNVATGEATLDRDLFTIPSYGPEQSLSLSYNSGDSNSTGKFGTGWSSNLTQYLSLESGFIIWHQSDGERVDFGQINGVWTVGAGHYETLTPVTGGGFKIIEPDHSSYTFDSNGRLVAITDEYGQSLTIAWAVAGATATDASGRATTLSLNAAGQISAAKDSAGRSWNFHYTNGYLDSITDPAANHTDINYDSAGRLARVHRSLTPLGGSAAAVDWVLAYDTSGRVHTVTDPIGGTVAGAPYSYFEYAAGTTTAHVLRDVSTPATPISDTTTYNLNANGWLTSVVDADNWTTSYGNPESNGYDSNGNLRLKARQIDTAGHLATTTYGPYSAAGEVQTVTDPAGVTTTTSYSNDGFDNLTTKVMSGPAGSNTAPMTTFYLYDSSHRLCLTIDNPTVAIDDLNLSCTSFPTNGDTSQNVVNRFTYNAQNQLEDQTNPLGVVTHHLYDSYGNELSVTQNYRSGVTPDDSTNVTRSYTYDSAGNLLTETRPITTRTNPATMAISTYTYNALGADLTENDPGDSSIQPMRQVNTYDEFGNKTSTTDYSCDLNSDDCAHPVTLTTATTIYDALSHATRASTITAATDVSPEQTATSTTTYDLAGNALLSTGPTADATPTTSVYDGLGQLISATTSGTTTHTYDGLGHEVYTIEPASGDSTIATSHVYGTTGHLDSMTKDVTGTPATTTYTYDGLGRAATTTDATGQLTTTSYDGLGRVTLSVTGTSATGRSAVDTSYDRAGDVLTVSDPYGYPGSETTHKANAYDALGRSCRSVDNATVDVTNCTDSITSTATTNHVTTTYYDAAGDKIASVDTNGVIERTFYNVRALATKIIENCTDTGTTDPATCSGSAPGSPTVNIVTTNTYNATGARLGTNTVAVNVSNDTTDGGSGNPLPTDTVTSTVHNDTTYDGAGNLLSSIVDTDGLHLETDYAYDEDGDKIAEKSPAGVVTTTHYDANGHVDYTINDCAPVPSVWYQCGSSGPGQSDGTTNQVTYQGYDDADNYVSQTSPSGLVTKYVYSSAGQLTDEIDNYLANYVGSDPTVNATTTTGYDTAGRAISSKAPNGAVTLTIYGADGRVCRTVSNATYDYAGQLTNACTSMPAAGIETAVANIDTQYQYDVKGNQISVTKPSPVDGATPANRVKTDYSYDPNGHLCLVLENASVDPSVLTCDGSLPAGTQVTTSKNVETRYTYDAAGHMTSQSVPSDSPATGATAITTYGYDDLGRLNSVTDPDGNVAGASDATKALHTVRYTHDAAGNKTTEYDPGAGTIYYFYDGANRLCQRATLPAGVTYVAPSPACTQKVTGATIDTQYAYDADGSQTLAKDALSASGEMITVSPDALGQPKIVNDTHSLGTDSLTTYTYGSGTGTGWANQITRNDASGEYVFGIDTSGRQSSLTDMTTVSHPSGNPFSWTYDASGGLVNQTDPTGNKTTYSHDKLNRLTSQSTTACPSGCATYTYTYGYNAAGNKIASTSTIPGDPALGTATYAYDELSRLTTYTPAVSAATKTQTFAWNSMPDRASITTGTAAAVSTTYDAASRPTSGSYTTDAQGRIKTMPAPSGSGTQTLTWDLLGRLASVTLSGSTTTYSYDPLDRLEKIVAGSTTTTFAYVGTSDAVARTITTTSSGSTTTITANDLSGNALYQSSNNTPVYLHTDDHGDVTWTAGESGVLASVAAYDPFGNLVSGSVTHSATRWQSSYQDDSTGLYYVVARWYSPTMGDFLSQDPLDHEITDPQSRDEYAYGSGDPVDATDTTGQAGMVLNVKHYKQRAYSDYLVSPTRQKQMTAQGHTPCTEDIYHAGCFVTSLAMALDYFPRYIATYDGAGNVTGRQLPDPPTLVNWLNNQKSKGHNLNLINATSCDLAWSSGAMASRLHIKTIKKIRVGTWVNTWAQATAKGGVFGKISAQLAAGNLVIATVPSSPIHFVLITGWENWQFDTTKSQARSREFIDQVRHKATKSRGRHYTGDLGDFTMNDPEGAGPNEHLFARYGAIERLYLVRPAW